MNARHGEAISRRSFQARQGEPEIYELPFGASADEELFDVRRTLLTIWRGKLTIIGFALIGLLAGLWHVSRLEPVYIATTTLLYEPERLQIVDISSVLAESAGSGGLGNQIEVLNSTTVLGDAVKALGLHETGGETATSPADVTDEPVGGDTDESAVAEDIAEQELIAIRKAVNNVRRNLEVQQVPGSGVIEVMYRSSDPAMAARVANTITDAYLDFQQRTKNQDVLAAIELVNNRIEELKVSVGESERSLERARLDLTERRAQSAEMTSVQLAALNKELADIRLRLAESRARYQRANAALDAEKDLWTVTEFRESSLILDFRRKLIEIRETLAEENSITGGARSPAQLRSDALMEQIERSIQEEAGYIVAALDFEVASLEQREQQLEGMVRDLEVISIEQTADELFIDRLEREVQANQSLLQTFIARQKEISEQANLQSPDSRVLSRAEPPSSPDGEARIRLLTAAGGGGLLLGLFTLLFRERMNSAIRDPRELSRISGHSVLSSIPMTARRRTLQKLANDFLSRPKSLLAESVRNLRTSILYSDPQNQPKVVMFTSSVPGEGKSATSLLTGLASQNQTRRTILVNCDLRDERNAKLYANFPTLSGAKNRPGLAAYFDDRCSLEEALAQEPESGLHILALGKGETLTESPADMLSSDRFADIIKTLRSNYDLVILDTPPALAVTDARLLARLSDAIVYLVRWNNTNSNAVREGLREVETMGTRIVGVVFTLVSQRKAKKYADNEFIYKQSYAGYFK